jgi:CDP-diacylglycerol--glycerol-3-phosphate 3-phosphatidyltransferase
MRLISPLSAWLAARRVSPNAITLTGTLFWVLGGVLYGAGEIRAAGWLLGVTALFDVVDGQVARASGRSTPFGAFLDSTLDRIADGAVLGGLAFFYATSPGHGNAGMLVVCIAGLVGTLLISYTRARAEGLGLNGKVGAMQRPERVILLSAPQAFFGLALGGFVLASIVVFLTAVSWLTVVQRIVAAYRSSPDAPSSVERGRMDLPSSEVLALAHLQPGTLEANKVAR